jgi:glycosyltransferase involved in cell wall biosynthesis
MKILTLVWSLGPGGTERAAANYAIAYKLAGADSRVLILGEGYERVDHVRSAGVPVIALLQEANGDGPLQDLASWGADIIHTHNFVSAFVPFIKQLKKTNTKVVETNVFSRPNFSADYCLVDASFQLSGWGLWKYRHWMGRTSAPPLARVVPNIVFDKDFPQSAASEVARYKQQFGIPESAFVIGRIGQAHPSKWSLGLVKILVALMREDPRIYVLLVGVPAAIKKKLLNLGDDITNRVKLIDYISGDRELALYYHSLSVFAHISSIGESFGYVLAEAMVCRVPVVTLLTPLKDNAQYEVVGHGTGGLCVSSRAGFVRAVKQLAIDKELYARLQQNLDRWVAGRFSPGLVSKDLLCFYEDLLNGSAVTQPVNSRLVKEQFTLFGWRRFLLYPMLRLINSPFIYRMKKSIRP